VCHAEKGILKKLRTIRSREISRKLGTQNIIHLSVHIPSKVARPGGMSDLMNVCIIIVLGLMKRSGLSSEGEGDLEGKCTQRGEARASIRVSVPCAESKPPGFKR